MNESKTGQSVCKNEDVRDLFLCTMIEIKQEHDKIKESSNLSKQGL